MRYIADSIGTKYEEWLRGIADNKVIGDTVFISSPTGSGKSTFILKVFFPYLAKKRKNLLYLVNRTVLKKQLEKEIVEDDNLDEFRGRIKIELYQTIENEMLHGPIKNNEYLKFDCVVCDEAHYFLMDSNYNTNTILSYIFVKALFGRKLRIYMSATIEHIREYIEKDNKETRYDRTPWFGFHSDVANRAGIMQSVRAPFVYSAEQDYKHIDIGIIVKREDIAEIVSNGSSKWLIFVDSKDFGKKLKKDIVKRTSDKEMVAFITSDYEQDSDENRVVHKIVNKKTQAVNVLIATSVLDNGISISDIELRNIIIITDTKTEFIQMLGRKRSNKNPYKVYIFKHDRDHFTKRLSNMQRRLKLAKKSYINIQEKIQPDLDAWSSSMRPTDEWNKICARESYLIRWQHDLMMQEIMKKEMRFEDIQPAFLYCNGTLVLNLLSLQNLKNLKQFYKYILKEFDDYGEDAFLREQLRWLGKTDDEADEIISKANISQLEKCQQNVIERLRENINKPLKEKESKDLRDNMRDDLTVLVNSVKKGTLKREMYLGELTKKGRNFSGPFMDFLRENCGIPFIMEVKDKIYTIRADNDKK